MATYVVLRWRDIPAVVEAQDADGTVTVALSDKFQALIDAVAVQLGLDDSDAYLDSWRRTEPVERPGTAGAVAAAVAAELEAGFPELAGRAFGRP